MHGRKGELLRMISYCTNIYPAESWKESFSALEAGIPAVYSQLEKMDSPALLQPLGVGLRLSARAAEELLAQPGEINRLKHFLGERNAVVQTLNGFPYGNFHGQRVKEFVFKPDWTTPERFEYTCKLVEILSRIAPEDDIPLTVSTLPGSHKWFKADEQRMIARLDALCGFMDRLHRESGKLITVGLEPEPMGHFDDTFGAIHFFQNLLNVSRRPELIQRHLGITYDTCHFAVMRESPEFTLPAWEENDIPVVKIQFSNALELQVSSLADLAILHPYAEPIYFHQTSVLLSGQNSSEAPLLFPDLTNALLWAENHQTQLQGSQWRVHYHIPLGSTPEPPISNTHAWNHAVADYLKQHPDFCPALEVETYTWSVLPLELKQELSCQIATEIDTIQCLVRK